MLIEQNSAKTGHMFGSECGLKIHVQNLGYALDPFKHQEPQNHLFSTF